MLTREEARGKVCPHMLRVAKCVAENCPKWVDEGIGIDAGLICPKASKCDTYNGGIAFVCNKCSQRYGRCGS